MKSRFLQLIALQVLALLAHAEPPNPTVVDGQDEQIQNETHTGTNNA